MSTNRNRNRFALIGCIVAACCIDAHAQVDTIRANPNAVALRSIWSRRGNGIGNAIAGLWDIDGDGRSEFAAQYYDSVGTWQVFGLDSFGREKIIWEHRFLSPDPMFWGDFFGNGKPVLVGVRARDTAILGRLYWLEFFAVASGRVEDMPFAVWHSRQGDVRLISTTFQRADLNADGANELIVAAPVTNHGGVPTRHAEIWIYQGGSQFSLESPTVIVDDTSAYDGFFSLRIGRIDGDAYPDLICETQSHGRILWGGPDIMALDRAFDREFVKPGEFLQLGDLDGDLMSDLLWGAGPALYLSSSGKDPRHRSYDVDDDDRVFVGRGTYPFVAGPMNDSGEHYDMFGLSTAMGDNTDILFSGRVDGPDARYDAWYNLASDGLGSGYAGQDKSCVGDVDGNGWRDFMMGNEAGSGIAIVIGGGPYIPRDSMPASAIREIAVDDRTNAITVWPNPVSDAVHIAWRGDLGRTPESFEVFDMLGREVARGEANHSRGEAVWQCAHERTGVYALNIYDRNGSVIATVSIVKR